MDERYDPEALRLARQAAGAGEQVLWAGRPGRRIWPGWPVVAPVATVALVFGLLTVNGDWARMRPGIIATVVVMVLLMKGLALIPGLLMLRRRSGEIYAATSRRVLILGRDGTVRHSVGLEEADAFRRMGRTVTLGGEAEAAELGKRDPDGGLRRFDQLPRLERLADAEQVLATIRGAAARR